MTRIAVIGAGNMARVRTRALVATGRADVCGVAARHVESAERFGSEFGCALCVDDYMHLLEARPEAVLVEVPHSVQDAAVLWALGQGLHVLIGGAPAGSSDTMGEITGLADSGGLVVETGYEARYTPLWQEAKRLIDDGHLGRPVAVRSIALWPGDPASWYYRQRASGGMPLAHMTYCFINPVRWLLGNPHRVSAFANRVKETGPEMIREETCIANLLLPAGVLYSATAGFVRPGAVPGWSVTIIGTRAAIELEPAEDAAQTMTVYGPDGAQQHDFGPHAPAFQAQAEAFLNAVSGAAGGATCLNPPDDARWDTRIAEAIVESVRSGRTVDV
jgi:myo-inositol 2-dehydrogenase / D-chiro-inositol 1-dehydrogenase